MGFDTLGGRYVYYPHYISIKVTVNRNPVPEFNKVAERQTNENV